MIDKTDYWVDIIYQQELPAIASTASLLSKFANDDKSSLPKLSQSILHDQALSSCVLKVANSIPHMGRNKISTISRATVVLGIHAVKNICLTAKLLDSLLKSKNLSEPVYNHLVQLMANSFYAGLLAKMMVPNFDEDTQEEVYLAAMLYRIGETAFWSAGGDKSEQLIKHINLPSEEFEDKCEEIIGTTFHKISKGLAKRWQLGELLEKSLDQPESRTAEMKIIYLADKLSSYIGTPPSSSQRFTDVLDQICQLKHTSLNHLKNQIAHTREDAIALLNSYGTPALENAIKQLPTIKDFQRAQQQSSAPVSHEKLQLNLVMELTKLTRSSKDLNAFIQLTVTNLARNYALNTCTFYMLTSDKSELKARFSQGSNDLSHNFNSIVIAQSQNLFAECVKSNKPAVVNDYQQTNWRDHITAQIEPLIAQGPAIVAPVSIQGRIIGIIFGQKHGKTAPFTIDEFEQYCFTIEHLNMCISMITR